MKILIGADIMPTQTNIKDFISGDAMTLVGEELCKELNEATYRIFNLETPLVNDTSPIDKVGANFGVPTAVVNGLASLNVDFVTLANNHIMDQGEIGLASTIKTLNKACIQFGGIGCNQEDARKKTNIVHIENKTVGIYCCCESEFSIATKNEPGANSFDPLNSLDDIESLRLNCDYLICLYHGGKEYYRYPSPYLQKVCRRIADKGADLVVCQHSHCIGSYEQYKQSTIVYGQGNFLFDDNDDEYQNTGMLIEILDDGQIDFYFVEKAGAYVKACDDQTQRRMKAELDKRSSFLLDPSFIEKEYKQFAAISIDKYLNIFRGHESLVFRIVNRMLNNWLRANKNKKLYHKNELFKILNVIECEAHRELFVKGLKERSKNIR